MQEGGLCVLQTFASAAGMTFANQGTVNMKRAEGGIMSFIMFALPGIMLPSSGPWC